MDNPTYEYLPYLGRVVWIKYDTVEDTQIVDGIPKRFYIWARWSWSDSESGPWTDFRWMPCGVANF